MADDNAVVDGSAVRVDAGGWGLTWAADDAGCLRQVGLGPEGATAQLGEIPLALFPDAYPTYGEGTPSARPPCESPTPTAASPPGWWWSTCPAWWSRAVNT
nr:hypothetical protein [Candidatus Microthrix sp.]